jgi:hypothetical protein
LRHFSGGGFLVRAIAILAGLLVMVGVAAVHAVSGEAAESAFTRAPRAAAQAATASADQHLDHHLRQFQV